MTQKGKVMNYSNRCTIVILITASLMLSACENVQQNTIDTAPIEQQAQSQSQPQPVEANRFQNAPDEPTAIDKLIKLAQEKADLSEKYIEQLKSNNKVSNENAQLRQVNKQLTAELEQTKTELNQTNKLLIEMRAELDQWKSKILEFHNESRNTDKAQLEALFKILQLIGGQNEN